MGDAIVLKLLSSEYLWLVKMGNVWIRSDRKCGGLGVVWRM